MKEPININLTFFNDGQFMEILEENTNFQVNIDNFDFLGGQITAEHILSCAFLSFQKPADKQINIKFVDEIEGQQLNFYYRHKDYATNIISFENEQSLQDMGEMGDLAICLSIVHKEAAEQNKSFIHHLSHLLVHGCLHLQGFDHLTDSEATIMENLEIEILAKLGIDNPYLLDDV